MMTALVDVVYTRSMEVAIDVIRLKSPMTVRSSGRQSRLRDCAGSAAATEPTRSRVRNGVRTMEAEEARGRKADGQTVGRSDGRTVRRSDGQTVRRSDGQTVRTTNVRNVGRSSQPRSRRTFPIG